MVRAEHDVDRPGRAGLDGHGPELGLRRRTGPLAGHQVGLAEQARHEAGRGPGVDLPRACPTCSMRPSCMTATRSPTASASSWSCVTSTAVGARRRSSAATVSLRTSSRSPRRGWRTARPAGAAGARCEGAGQRDALLLPARELVRVAAPRARPGRRARAARRRRRCRSRPRRRAGRRPRCRRPAGAGTARRPGRRRPTRRSSGGTHLPSPLTTRPPTSTTPSSGCCRPASSAEQCRLAAPAGPDEREVLARGDREVDPVDGDRGPEPPRHAAERGRRGRAVGRQAHGAPVGASGASPGSTGWRSGEGSRNSSSAGTAATSTMARAGRPADS